MGYASRMYNVNVPIARWVDACVKIWQYVKNEKVNNNFTNCGVIRGNGLYLKCR